MLLRRNPRLQGLRRVIRQHRHLRLGNHRAAVNPRIDPMHRAAALALARSQHRLMHAQAVHPRAAKLRQQRRMQIHHSVRKTRHQRWRNNAQKTGKHHQITIRYRRIKRRGKVRRLAIEQHKRHARRLGMLPARAVAVGNHRFYLRANLAARDRIEQRFQIAAAAGNQHHQRFHQDCSLNCKACWKKAAAAA